MDSIKKNVISFFYIYLQYVKLPLTCFFGFEYGLNHQKLKPDNASVDERHLESYEKIWNRISRRFLGFRNRLNA